jgi:hypothetical protein
MNAVCVVESVAFVALQQQYFCISLVADFAAQQVVADGVFGVCGKCGVVDWCHFLSLVSQPLP